MVVLLAVEGRWLRCGRRLNLYFHERLNLFYRSLIFTIEMVVIGEEAGCREGIY